MAKTSQPVFRWSPALTCMCVRCSILVGSDASVMTNWLWNLLNVGVALVGYHAAAFSIDWKWWGRKRMQVRQDCCFAIHAWLFYTADSMIFLAS